MTPIAWVIAATVLVALVIGLIVLMALRLGAMSEREDRAEEERDAARGQAERMAGPMPGKVERARAALRKLRERGVRVD